MISVYDVKDFMTGARTQRCVNHLVICRFARQLRNEQRNWSAVQDAAKPFLVLFKGVPATETYEQPQDRRLALTKHILHYNLWLYLVADPSGQMVAETVINNIADAIDAAMQSPLFPGAR